MKRLAILFGLFIVGIIIFADLGELDIVGFVTRLPYGDKIGHFALYGILTLLIDLAIISPVPSPRRGLLVLQVALVLALVIGLEEFSQRYFPSRTFDLVDLAFSYLGVIFFSLVALMIKK